MILIFLMGPIIPIRYELLLRFYFINNCNIQFFTSITGWCISYNIGCCIRCWSVTRLFGGWRLAPLYLAIGVALILWPHNLWLSYVAGTQIILLAIFRLLTILRFSGHRKGQELLPQFDDGYDKYNLATHTLILVINF